MSDDHADRKPEARARLRPGPKGGKRDANRRRRIKDLCDAGLSLFLQRGIEGVTIDDIVRAAGVAKGSFYRYFADKTDLVATIFAPQERRVIAAFHAAEAALLQAAGREELFAAYQLLAEGMAEILVEDPDVFLLYLQENRAPGVGARAPLCRLAENVDRLSIALTNIAHSRALLRPIEPRVSARSVVGAVEKLLHGLLTGEDLGEPTDIPETLISMILDGLRPASQEGAGGEGPP